MIYIPPLTEKEILALKILEMTSRDELEGELNQLTLSQQLSGSSPSIERSLSESRWMMVQRMAQALDYQRMKIEELQRSLEQVHSQLDCLGVALNC